MRSRAGDDFRSPVRETVIINGCHGRVTSMSASLGPVALAKRLSRFFFSAWTIRMDDSAIALLDPTSAPGTRSPSDGFLD